jgi:hypothetical protein
MIRMDDRVYLAEKHVSIMPDGPDRIIRKSLEFMPLNPLAKTKTTKAFCRMLLVVRKNVSGFCQ